VTEVTEVRTGRHIYVIDALMVADGLAVNLSSYRDIMA